MGGCHLTTIGAAVVPGTFGVDDVKVVVAVAVKAEGRHSVRASHLR